VESSGKRNIKSHFIKRNRYQYLGRKRWLKKLDLRESETELRSIENKEPKE
jgi:hypothetical protein